VFRAPLQTAGLAQVAHVARVRLTRPVASTGLSYYLWRKWAIHQIAFIRPVRARVGGTGRRTPAVRPRGSRSPPSAATTPRPPANRRGAAPPVRAAPSQGRARSSARCRATRGNRGAVSERAAGHPGRRPATASGRRRPFGVVEPVPLHGFEDGASLRVQAV